MKETNSNIASEGYLQWEKAATEAGASEELVMPRLDELSEKQIESIAQHYRLVCLIKGGMSVSKSINHLGLKLSISAAYKLLNRFNLYGVRGLVDQRFGNKKKKSVLTDELKKRIVMWLFARPAAGPRAIWKQIVKECQEHKVAAPGYDTVKKYIKSLPEAYRLFRRGKIGIHEWEKRFCPVVRFNLTTYSNQRWQTDHTRLKIWVRIKVGDRWVPVYVYLSAYLDAHSHSIPGTILSTKNPDAWTSALLMTKAALPKENPNWKNKGLPSIVQPDRGRDFLSHAVAASFAALGIALDPDPPYYPNRKGKIERWFLTLDRGCLRMLPGHMDAIGKTKEAAEKHVHLLLTLPQLSKEIEKWIVEDYHQQTNSETGRKPAEMWEETVRLRMPESEDALNLLLLKYDRERTVFNTGIKFTFGNSATDPEHEYWAPELIYHIGRKVRLRYNPEDRQSILVYCAATGEYICEAWLMGQENSRYSIEDVKRNRNEFRRGLHERIKDYKLQVEREDRQNAQQVEWETARRIALEQEEAARQKAEDALDEEHLLEDLLMNFNRQDGAFDEGEEV
jgi:transposase InsO family protein